MPAIAAIRVEYMLTNTAHDFHSWAWIGVGPGAPIMDRVGVVRGHGLFLQSTDRSCRVAGRIRGHGPLLQGGGFLVTCRDAPLL